MSEAKCTPVIRVIFVMVLTIACHPADALLAPEPTVQAARTTATTAALTGGYTTTQPQNVTIVSDTRHKLELHADQAVFQSTLDLNNTIAAGTIDCVTDPADVSPTRKDALLLKLQDQLQNRFFNAFVDRRNLGAVSEQHRVAHTWTEGAGLFTVRLGAAPNLLPGVFASAHETGKDVFQFSGGALLIADRTGQTADHLYMACVNRDVVTLTINR